MNGLLSALPLGIGYAARRLRRHPIATAAAIVSIALGIGANALLFGVVDAMLFRSPPGIGHPGELVRVSVLMTGPPGTAPEFVSLMSYPDLTLLRSDSRTFGAVTGFAPMQVTLGAGAEAHRLTAVLVTPEYFRVLEVTPEFGRFPVLTQSGPGAAVEPEVALSHTYWRRAFGSDPGVLGRTLRLNGRLFSVVGVAPPGFVGADAGAPDLWVPLELAEPLGMGSRLMEDPSAMWVSAVGRLHPGESREQAANALTHTGPDGRFRLSRLAGPRSMGVMRWGGPRGVPVSLWFLGVTLVMFLIACANVANMLLARGKHYQGQAEIRFALGASRGRLMRDMLVESALLAILGGVGAVLVVVWGEGLLRFLPLPPLPSLMDVRTLSVTLGLSVVTTALIGILPARRASRVGTPGARRVPAGRPRASGGRAGEAIVVSQLAGTFVLLAGALLFVRSLGAVRGIDPGYDLDRRMVVWVDAPEDAVTRFDAEAFAERAAARLRTLPGVEAVGTASFVPFRFESMAPVRVPRPGGPGRDFLMAGNATVGADYFEAMAIPLVAGRGFSSGDRMGSPPVAVVSETMARRLWSDANAVGRCFEEVPPSGASGGPCIEVIGVVRDAQVERLMDDPRPYFYWSLAQGHMPDPMRVLHVRTHASAQGMTAAVRGLVQGLDAELPWVNVETVHDLVHEQVAPWEIGTLMFSLFGVLALVLTAIGLYGVVSLLVATRTRELGVRMALGARPGNVVGLVLGRVTRLAAGGVVLGLAGAAALGRAVAGMMYGVRVSDPITYAAVALALVVVALAAAAAPALRAARTDPMAVLRSE